MAWTGALVPNTGENSPRAIYMGQCSVCHGEKMADAALAHVDGSRAILAGVGDESARPGHHIRIDVDDSGFRIDGRTAPVRAAVEARKNYGVFSDAEGNELTFATEFLEIVQCPLMNFRRAHG